MAKYTRPRRGSKTVKPPKKPYPAFPLSPHSSGAWQKKICGKTCYFGRWGHIRDGKMERLPDDGWQAALALYKAQADDLHAGRTPRVSSTDGLTVKDLCNRFLTAKQRKVDAGELSPRSLVEYTETCKRLAEAFGKTRRVDDLAGDDFESLRAIAAKRWGPVRLANEITRVKTIFKYALANALIEREVRFGSEFVKPDKATMRKHKAASDKKLFEATEIQQLLAAASVRLRAAILLGINAGLGNTDIASLQQRNLKKSWLDFPRTKTGVGRRVPLWPETLEALQATIGERPAPKSEADAECVFLHTCGERYVRLSAKSRTDYLAREFGALLRKLKINGRRGLGFYSLRHTFATIALQTGDRDAVKSLMGHAHSDMLSAYDETGPSDDRLLAVTKHVRHWLVGEGGAK